MPVGGKFLGSLAESEKTFWFLMNMQHVVINITAALEYDTVSLLLWKLDTVIEDGWMTSILRPFQ